MNGNSLLIDTNIALYLFNGSQTVANTLQDNILYVSFITQLELLGYNGSKVEMNKIQKFISECHVIDINDQIKQVAVQIRRNYKIKLPDAIIAATSHYLDIPLFTADEDFTRIKNLSLILYSEASDPSGLTL